MKNYNERSPRLELLFGSIGNEGAANALTGGKSEERPPVIVCGLIIQGACDIDQAVWVVGPGHLKVYTQDHILRYTLNKKLVCRIHILFCTYYICIILILLGLNS